MGGQADAGGLEPGTWIKPFNEVFLGLDQGGVIRRVFGMAEAVLGISPDQISGSTWTEFIEKYASDPARLGLKHAWLAVAEQRVMAEHCPAYFPFKHGVSIRLRRVQDEPGLSLVAHLSTDTGCGLDSLIGQSVLDAMDHVVRLNQHMFRGVDGPLTDKQVKEVGSAISGAANVKQLLEDLRSEVFSPFVVAPLPYTLSELLAFSGHDFSSRRVATHQLTIRCNWSAERVYCYSMLRDVVRRLLEALISGVAPQSTITLSDRLDEQEQVVRAEIRYFSQEPSLVVERRMEPLALSDPARFGPVRPIQSLVTTIQSCLRPVGGKVWVEPCPEENAMACIRITLPRWRGTVLDK